MKNQKCHTISGTALFKTVFNPHLLKTRMNTRVNSSFLIFSPNIWSKNAGVKSGLKILFVIAKEYDQLNLSIMNKSYTLYPLYG